MIRFVNPTPGRACGQPAEVQFANGNQAIIYAAAGDADEAVARLGLIPQGHGKPVLLACGGADDLTGVALVRASETLGPAIAAAAKAARAIVIDGGTASGVMQITGMARAQHPGAIPVLVGVAPAGKVTFPGGPDDPGLVRLQDDHSHFILAAASDWGGETALMMAVSHAVAGGTPVVMTLAGGGRIAGKEALEATRRGWPVFVITGTGGLADHLAELWDTYRVPHRRRLAILLPRRFRHRPLPPVSAVEDPDLREIITKGDLRLVSGSQPSLLARQLAWELQDACTLKHAWHKFATYDQLAGRLRKAFTRVQGTILALGVTATLLALIYNQVGGTALHWAVVAVPILASVLIAQASRSATGQRWVMLRAAAEAIKSEIYQYRARGDAYSANARAGGQLAAQEALAARLAAVDAKLMQTQASSGPLTPYNGPLPPPMYGAASDEDGLSALDAEQYLRIRVGDQLSYYHGKIRKLSRRRSAFQILAIAGGGAGTLIAAAGLDVWVGLTSGVAAAALAYLGYLQVDNTIVSYNQSATALHNLRTEWDARSPQNRTPEAASELISNGESVLTAELAGWVQQMNDALRELATRADSATKHRQDVFDTEARP